MIDSDIGRTEGASEGSGLPSVAIPFAPSREVAETFEEAPIGDYLRRQRVLRDVTLEELASLTRIPLRSLERLERGEFDGETDGFVRGFVRTVAIALGLDVEDTVSRMLHEPAVPSAERVAANRRTRQIGVLAVLVLLLATGLFVLQAGWRLMVGASDDPARAVVVWRDPVRALADEQGVEVDPAQEIAPGRGSLGRDSIDGR